MFYFLTIFLRRVLFVTCFVQYIPVEEVVRILASDLGLEFRAYNVYERLHV